MVAPMAPHIASEMWKGIYTDKLYIDVPGKRFAKNVCNIVHVT